MTHQSFHDEARERTSGSFPFQTDAMPSVMVSSNGSNRPKENYCLLNFRAQQRLVQNSLVLSPWMPSLSSKSPGEWGARDHAVVCDM